METTQLRERLIEVFTDIVSDNDEEAARKAVDQVFAEFGGGTIYIPAVREQPCQNKPQWERCVVGPDLCITFGGRHWSIRHVLGLAAGDVLSCWIDNQGKSLFIGRWHDVEPAGGE